MAGVTRTCPDCGVEMEETNHKTTYNGDVIHVNASGGLLGALDLKGWYVETVVCPDCGLVRFYAATE